VDVADPAGGLMRVDVVTTDALHDRLATAARTERVQPGTPQRHVLHSGEPLLFPQWKDAVERGHLDVYDVEPALLALAPSSVMFVPMVARSGVLGVLTFATTLSRRRYGATELTAAVDLAARCAMAIENSRLMHEKVRALSARQELLSIVSHDLKNPLSAIMLGVAQLLATSRLDDRRRGRKQLEAIRRGADTMDRMIRDLVDLASIEAGRLSVEVEELDVVALVRESLTMFEPLAIARGLQLRAELPPAPIVVCADRGRVLQVLSNVVGNALKFTPHGEVMVAVRADGERVVITVADTGVGIAPDLLMHVFERYAQAAATAKQGRGLGLFIAKNIVEAQGGALSVESELGIGSTFSVVLPRAESPTARVDDAVPAAPAPHGAILIVDDDVDAREMLAELIEEQHIGVAVAGNGEEALAILRAAAELPQLILLDLHMPVMDGWATMVAIAADERLRTIPVVLVSSFTDAKGAAQELGAAGFLRKPLEVARVLELLRMLAPR
jgi:signal transduction histidine kinase/CheY-like chemotaxis protein